VTPLGIPTSLHDSLMARLDRLGSVRRVAQIGAAIGREFSYALLRAVSRFPRRSCKPRSNRLVDSELVFSARHAPMQSIPSNTLWCRTRRIGSLLRNARQQLHAQIAEALEAQSPSLSTANLSSRAALRRGRAR